ncbi:Formylglycine-generating enzyme [Achromobacter deleyi]|uniref:Formylglycine-generating enzyme n=2 Tax=Achromobacter deleyi TaxID=1353891 RepID=A0A6S6Z9W4_9BURK|nr:Formylglycine-generating enzyme [Achromobacter deleyi]CAB3832227.1 Formylglycine-generating enzyme [Achromobacter deleyi]CAB3856760.1 Formylglycine-generating enzyme [Achromobacter deleyi]
MPGAYYLRFPFLRPVMRLPIALALLCTLATVPAWSAEPPALVENSLGMTFVHVPAGTFQMGSDETPEALARDFPQYPKERFAQLFDEAPVHTVRITRPFYLERTEVTVGQFRRFIEASGYVPESEADGTGGYGYNAAYDPDKTERGDAFEGRDTRYSWRNPGFAQTDDHPVVNVSWNDATALARWLSQQEGRVYRLPTEAEWEYAARAGGRTRYQHGDDPAGLPGVANTFDADAAPLWPKWQAFAAPRSDGHTFTAPVATYAPNAFGLYDMHGNAWEWVADWYGEDYYAQSPQDDPQGPASGNVRVRRGGSWHTWALYVRSAYRNWNTAETRYPLVGFRLLREAD